MLAALLTTGQVAAQEWGAQAPAETPSAEGAASAEEIEDEAGAQLEADETPKVTGFSPPGQSAEPGMGTQAAERERARRSIGTVGDSVRASGKTEDAIPLKFQFHGYYRTRYNWVGNAPLPTTPALPSPDWQSKNASYGYMRLRIDPEVTYGPNPDLPIARLRFTIDGFDNVVFGDNAPLCRRPVVHGRQWIRPSRIVEARARMDRVPGAHRPDARRSNGIALGHGAAHARR
jgi:hypothetical protein